MNKYIKTFWYIGFMLLSIHVTAQKLNYGDKRFINWSNLFINGHDQELLKSVRNDLLSSQPHPLASYVWLKTNEFLHSVIDTADELYLKRPELKDLFKISQLMRQHREKEIFNQYTFEQLDKICDPRTLTSICGFYKKTDRTKASEAELNQLKRFGLFMDAWSITLLATSESERLNILKVLDNYSTKSNSHAVAFVKSLLMERNPRRLLRLKAIEDYLKNDTTDASASSYKADILSDLEWVEESQKYSRTAFTQNPFSEIYLADVIKKSIFLQRDKESEELIKVYISLYFPTSDKKLKKDEIYAEDNISLGNFGKAREILNAALGTYGHSPELLFLKGKLEQKCDRQDEAFQFYNEAISSSTEPKLEYFESIVDLLANSKDPRAERYFDIALKRFPFGSEKLFNSFCSYLRKVNQLNAAINLIEDALKIYPQSESILAELSYCYLENKQFNESLNTLKKTFELENPNSWTSYLYFQSCQGFDTTSANKEVEFIRTTYPWIESVWENTLREKKDFNYWNNVASINSNRSFPYLHLINLYSEREMWDNAIEVLINVDSIINKEGTIDDISDLLYYTASLYSSKSKYKSLTEEEIQKAKVTLAEYLKLKGNYATYLKILSQLYLSAGEIDKALDCTTKCLIYRPDDMDIHWDLIAKYPSKYGICRAFKEYYNYYFRDPSDKNRLGSFLKLHTLWDGSPISALAVIKYTKDNFPELMTGDGFKFYESKAFSLLGEHAKFFINSYSRSTALNNSDRYIEWYKIYKRNAIELESSSVVMDYSTNEATIVFPDGATYKRKDNIEFGRCERISIGPYFISARYDSVGNLQSLTNSAGTSIQFSYAAQNLIDRITDDKGDDISLEYNNFAKPTFIRAKGLGSIQVEYDSVNNISSIKSLNIDGKEGSQSIGRKITSIFNEIISFSKVFEKLNTSNGKIVLDDLGLEDVKYTLLYHNYSIQNSKVKSFMPGAELVKYLVNNLHLSSHYIDEALSISNEVFEMSKSIDPNHKNREINKKTVELISLYRKLLNEVRANGLDKKEWKLWTDMQDWLVINSVLQKVDNSSKALLDSIRTNPIGILNDNQWLAYSILNNKGCWKKISFNDLAPQSVQNDFKMNQLYYSPRGKLFVASNKGVSVFNGGYWEYFYVDNLNKRLSKYTKPEFINGSSNIISISGDSTGSIFLATANEIYSTDESLNLFKAISNTVTLPKHAIENLIVYNEKEVYVKTSSGVYLFNGDSFQPLSVRDEFRINFIKKGTLEKEILLGTDKGLYSYNRETKKYSKICSIIVEDALAADDTSYYVLSNNSVKRMVRMSDGSYMQLSLYGEIVKSKIIHGLHIIPIGDAETGIAILTDMGITIYNKNNLSFLNLPFSDQNFDVINLEKKQYMNTFAVLTNSSLLLFEDEKSNDANEKLNVRSILNSKKYNITYVASDNKLLAYREKGIIENVDFISSNSMALDNHDRLITNDGLSVYRYNYDSLNQVFSREQIFYALQTEKGNYKSGPIRKILVAHDNSIWVVAGLSLFHCIEDSLTAKFKVQEFNYFKDENEFPSRTEMIHYVFETIDNKIMVVCSDEEHLDYNGKKLVGGLLEYLHETNKFERINTDSLNYDWFIDSYTKLDEEKVILGTTSGFASGTLNDIHSLENEVKEDSYNRLLANHPKMFLSTKGVHLKDNWWIFGCAEGVVLYNNILNQWLYPEKLNEMLPEDIKYNKYGSRGVNDLDIDNNGRIFIGTNYGLIIYDANKSDPISLLLTDGYLAETVGYFNQKLEKDVSNILIHQFPPESKEGKIIDEFSRSKNAINDLETKLSKKKDDFTVKLVSQSERGRDKLLADSLDREIKILKSRQYEILQKMEQQNPSLYSMLEVKPLDLVTEQSKIKEGEVLVQYLPTDNKLYISVLARDKIALREVNVASQWLFQKSLSVSQILTHHDYIHANASDDSFQHGISYDSLRKDLCSLYDILLKPVENDIEGYKAVTIIPVKELYYLPFAALIRRNADEYEYAVQRYNLGYLTSFYLLDLVLEDKSINTNRSLVLGNPDGTLKGAEEEAMKVQNIIDPADKPFLGESATYKSLEDNSSVSRFVHLATHGRLFESDPSKSYILLANDYRMGLKDIVMLNLVNSEMVVLSACESGLGAKGMEYISLARSFVHAGAKSLVATLWSVNDKASTNLVVNFYKNIMSGQNKYQALANAQKEMIRSKSSDFNRIENWAGYVIFGKW